MKKRDAILLGVTLAILAVVGILIYSQANKKSASATDTTVEVIEPISADFNQDAIKQLGDTSQVVNFSQPVNLTNLGNSQPFGPLR